MSGNHIIYADANLQTMPARHLVIVVNVADFDVVAIVANVHLVIVVDVALTSMLW